MPFRLYVAPIITTVIPGKGSVRLPKYVYSGLSQVLFPVGTGRLGFLAFGQEPSGLIGADFAAADDAFLAGQADVQALPVDLTPTLTGGQVAAVRTFLENLNIAAGWVSTADTWKGVVRSVCGMFSFWQRYSGVYLDTEGTVAPSVFASGVTLETTFGSLPAAVQAAMLATATDQGIPTTGLTAGTKLRAIEKNMADFYATRIYDFNGVTI